jgi:hypothetical protein
MKSIIIVVILALTAIVFPQIISCGNSCHRNRTIADLKSELRALEIDSASHLLEMRGTVDSIDMGLLFMHDYVPQIDLVLKSNACVARLKDITVAVDFISKTGSKIGEKQITVYEYIEPNNSITFQQNIDVPDQTTAVELRLLNVKGE